MATDSLKQRLVGGATLLVVAVIAWFWLLSADSPIDPVARESQIPAAPDIKPFTVPEPSAPAGIEPIGSERDSQPVAQPVQPAVKAAPVPLPASAPKIASPKPQPLREAASATKAVPKVDTKVEKSSKLVAETFQLDQHGLPIAWVVQVGLFSTQTSADKIKATLLAKGFKAYSEPFKSDKANGIKVFVGPKLSRERADAQKKAIDQLLKTNSMVVRFTAH